MPSPSIYMHFRFPPTIAHTSLILNLFQELLPTVLDLSLRIESGEEAAMTNSQK